MTAKKIGPELHAGAVGVAMMVLFGGVMLAAALGIGLAKVLARC